MYQSEFSGETGPIGCMQAIGIDSYRHEEMYYKKLVHAIVPG